MAIVAKKRKKEKQEFIRIIRDKLMIWKQEHKTTGNKKMKKMKQNQLDLLEEEMEKKMKYGT